MKKIYLSLAAAMLATSVAFGQAGAPVKSELMPMNSVDGLAALNAELDRMSAEVRNSNASPADKARSRKEIREIREKMSDALLKSNRILKAAEGTLIWFGIGVDRGFDLTFLPLPKSEGGLGARAGLAFFLVVDQYEVEKNSENPNGWKTHIRGVFAPYANYQLHVSFPVTTGSLNDFWGVTFFLAKSAVMVRDFQGNYVAGGAEINKVNTAMSITNHAGTISVKTGTPVTVTIHYTPYGRGYDANQRSWHVEDSAYTFMTKEDGDGFGLWDIATGGVDLWSLGKDLINQGKDYVNSYR